jgi:hypothetical protein
VGGFLVAGHIIDQLPCQGGIGVYSAGYQHSKGVVVVGGAKVGVGYCCLPAMKRV